MSNKYMRKERARACPVHQTIMEAAAKKLEDIGYFNKDDVLKDTRMGAMADSIRWDYIAEFISKEHGITLLPLALRFFKGIGEAPAGKAKTEAAERARQMNPGRFIAGGHGRKTHGYGSVTAFSGILTIAKLKNRQNMMNGAAEKFNEYKKECLKQYQLKGVPIPPELEDTSL